MLVLGVLFTKFSKMNKDNAFVESYAMGEMFWSCYRRDSARALYISSFQNCCFIWAVQPTPHQSNATSKTTVAVVSPLDYIRKQQVASSQKWIVESALQLLGNHSRETARSRMESSAFVFGSAEQWLSGRWRKALYGALHQTKVLVVVVGLFMLYLFKEIC